MEVHECARFTLSRQSSQKSVRPSRSISSFRTERPGLAMSQKSPRVWLAGELWSVRTPQAVAVAGVMLHGSLSVVDPLLIKWILDQGVGMLSARTAVIAIGAFLGVYALRIGVMYVGSLAALRTQQ